ncbi:hypothetical protein [Streptococcus suis]|uniref:hypothetical protein n=1 Tax=Streptococcus suis TaxID=1307 RepID=UPI002A7B6126|nr:hypothetical protein [Streptococcus suis]
MKNNLKLANHYYLLYRENKELRKIYSYIATNSNDTLSFVEKIIILKLHEFYKRYHKNLENKSISLDRFLGLLDDDREDYFEKSLNLFRNYFIAKGYEDILLSTQKKFLSQKEKSLKGDYDIKENLRSDKLKKRAEKILWHIPSKNSIHKLFLDDKSNKNKSLFYITNINNFESLIKFLNISKLDGTAEHFSFIYLKKALKKKKVDITSLENEHTQLIAELSDYYDLIKFYYFS